MIILDHDIEYILELLFSVIANMLLLKFLIDIVYQC